MRSRHFLFAVWMGLAACGPAAPAPTATLPTAPPAVVTATPQPTATQAAATATPRPTIDPEARATGLAATQAVLAARNTERASGTATAYVRQSETQQVVWATEIATQTPIELEGGLTSPSGVYRVEWLRSQCAEVSQPGGSGSESMSARIDTLILINSATGERSVIETQILFCGGLGAAGLAPVRWSADSRFLYYTTAAEGAPDGAPCYWTRPLVRLDVNSGDRAFNVEGVAAPDGITIASPLRNRIVIWAWDQADTAEIDLGEDVSETSRLVWSDRGAQLAVLAFDRDGCWGARAPWLVVIDREQGAITHRLDLSEVTWGAVPLARAPWWNVTLEWGGADTLRLTQIAGEDDARFSLTVGLTSGAVEISSP